MKKQGFWRYFIALNALAVFSLLSASHVYAQQELAASITEPLTPKRMFEEADLVVQGVMLSLALASVLSWSILFAKLLGVTLARYRLALLNRALAPLTHLHDLQKTTRDNDHPLVEIAKREYNYCFAQRGKFVLDGAKQRLEAQLVQALKQQQSQLMAGLGFLASVGSVAPFVGLFGTVWGIMNAFIGIAAAKTTSLAVVAPGLAEALLATAIGLAAAIPAVIFYNICSRQIAAFVQLGQACCNQIELISSRDLDELWLLENGQQAAQLIA